MPFGFQPPQPEGAMDAAQSLLGFAANSAPSVSGFGTRQSRVKNERPAVFSRHIMHWMIPEGPIIQMYINPQQAVYSDKKTITKQRTKGGFTLQYWGEELGTVRLEGTTGTSGIEGINVLHDIYRNEQLAFDPYALFVASAGGGSSGTAVGNLIGGTAGDVIGSILQAGADAATPRRPKPSPAQFAFTVELYWSGAVYRGFFEDFSVTERAENLGLFDYSINFTVTQKRGFRNNFMAWHRSATSGPSNSDPLYGRPRSFSSLVEGDQPQPRRESSGGGGDILGNVLGSFGDLF